jgi:uncharacterized membrane protein YsdA (DUF1294 family)
MPHELVLPAYILAVSLVAFAIMLCDLGRDRKGIDPLPWPLWAVASAAGGAFGTLAAFLVTRTHIAKATVAPLLLWPCILHPLGPHPAPCIRHCPLHGRCLHLFACT